MTTLTMGTTNPAKIAQIAGALAPIGVRVVGVADKKLLPEVAEDGTTVQENARKKATTYAQALRCRVFSMDNALYLEGLSPEEQPGIHVRRIGGIIRNSDDELLDHYQQVVRTLGDKVKGRWEFGVCVADPDGTVWETTIISPRIFTSQRSAAITPGYPLESIQIDPESNRHIADMSETEQAEFWQRAIGTELAKFVQSIP
jgi:8-oxo-dGTP diphosphatase